MALPLPAGRSGLYRFLKPAALLAFFACSAAWLQAQVAGDTSVCTGETVMYDIPPQAGATYLWSATGGNISGANNNDTAAITWGNPGTGTIAVAVYTNAGTTYVTQNVTIHPAPNPVITFPAYPTCPADTSSQGGAGGQPDGGRSDCFKVCEFATVTYSTPLNAGSTYQWIVTGAASFTGQLTNSVTVTWDSSLNGSLVVIETNQWGCVDSAELCVEKEKRPTAFFTSQSTVCLNQATLFNNLSTGAASYYWNFGDGNTSTSLNPTHGYSNAGTYTVTLIVFNACYCSDTFQRTISVDSLPGPEIECPAAVCGGDTQTYSTTTAGCTYQWGAIGGTILGPANAQQVTVAWGAGPVGVLWLYATGCGGLCTDTTFAYIPVLPATDTIAGPKKVCSPGCAKYSVTLFSGATYTWTLGNSGGTITNKHCNEVDICWPLFYQGNDTLTVQFYDSLLNCGGSAQLIIRVRDEMAVMGNSTVCVNAASPFTVNPAIPCNWNVYPSGPSILGNGSPAVTINWNNLTGSFMVTATPLNPFAVCNDSAVKQVIVLPKPARPGIQGDTIVCPNASYSYCSSSPGTVNWLITGGTPSSSTGNCVTVTWGGSGPYIVRAFTQMSGAPYCSSDTTVQNVLSALPLPVPAISGAGTGCVNGTTAFNCTTLYPAGSTFNWSVSPSNAGAIIAGQGGPSVTVEWGNNTGAASVQLTVTACSQTISGAHPVTLSPAPIPVVTQTGILCPGVAATLTATGGAYIAFNWSGPGGYTSASNPATITQGGIYHVTVTDNNGCTGSTQFTAIPQPGPVASISTADPTAYCIGTPFSVQLNALSNPNYTYLWSNGSTLNPTSVSLPGTYTVVVTDQNGCTALSNPITITQDTCNGTGNPCQPNGTVSFTHPAFYGCNPLTFINTSANASGFTWYYGDFTSSNTVNGNHMYAQAGFYLVTLSGYVPNTAGTDSCLLFDTAQVKIPLAPAFTYIIGCQDTPVLFTDLSTFTPGNNIISWNWNFGDTNTSTAQHPSHQYGAPGNYVVSLTVSDGTCSSTITDTITVLPLPNAAFTAPASACVGSGVLFTDASTPVGALNLWSWNWSDGGTSLNQNPSHQFIPAGTYTAQLAVRDTLGCVDTAMQSITIFNPSPIGNIAAFPDTVVCSGIPVLLVAPFCAGCTYNWGNSANDSITVTNTGIYTVTVTDPNGCSSSTFISIVVHPAPPAIIWNDGDDELCIGEFTSLATTNSANYLYSWMSNDGFSNGAVTNSVFVNSVVLGAGVYIYQVVITDTTTGCFDTSLAYTVIVHPLPASPNITVAGPSTVCFGDTVVLVGSHPDTTVQLQWSTGQVTDTAWITAGGTVVLTATDSNGCKSTASTPVTVNPLPETCCFWTGCLDTCRPFTIHAPAGSSSYQWLLNDTVISGATAQTYTAVLSGVYSVVLTNSFGCIDTAGPLDLMLHDCNDSICADLVIDSLACDSQGNHVVWYHITNYSGHTINEITFTVLPPNHNTLYAPVSVFETVLNGNSSSVHSATFYSSNPGDTMCFKAYVHEMDSMGHEMFCCNTDTECVVLPPCPKDSICCYLRFFSDSVRCIPNPAGFTYNVTFNLAGCGQLYLQSVDTGSITVSNPYNLVGPTTINFNYNSTVPQSNLCLTLLLLDNNKVCKDTTICIPIHCGGPVHPPCDFEFPDSICIGQAATYTYIGSPAGLTFNWTFAGGTPASATGPGPHSVTYSTAGCFPVSVTVTSGNQSSTCRDSICVVPVPVATVTQSGNTLYAYPAGLSYQWYQGPPVWQPVNGEVNQFFTPQFSTLFCVVVSNQFGCKDTACIDHQWVGIEGAALHNLKVYPSPADEWLKVSASLSHAVEVEIRLMNSVGAVVLERKTERQSEINMNLPLRTLPAGLYLLQINAGGRTALQRVLVQHR